MSPRVTVAAQHGRAGGHRRWVASGLREKMAMEKCADIEETTGKLINFAARRPWGSSAEKWQSGKWRL